MPRVSVNPGRDPDKPLVDIPPDTPPGMRVVLLGLRWYLVAIFALGLLGLAVWVLVILTLYEVEVAPFPLTRWGYAAAAVAGASWVMFSYSIGLW